MATKKSETSPTDPDDVQPPLVPMSDDEVKKAGRKLAAKVRELSSMKKAHAEQRSDMKGERDVLQAEIDAIASTIRTQGR